MSNQFNNISVQEFEEKVIYNVYSNDFNSIQVNK